MADVIGRPVTVEGIEGVEAALRAEDFPLDKQGLAYAVGEIEVRTRSGESVPVRDVLDGIEAATFASVEEAVSAICSALDGAADEQTV
jgi:hypothetical protein